MKKFSLYLISVLFLFASSAFAQQLNYGREKLKTNFNTQLNSSDKNTTTTITTGTPVGSGKGMNEGGGTI